MVFQKGQSGNPAYRKENTEKLEEIDKKIEELKGEKEKVEMAEKEISQFNALYLFTKNSLDLLHNRIMQIELWIHEVSNRALETEKIPDNLPPIEEKVAEFMPAEKKKGFLGIK